tara:strand:- start:403 stop:873 length:471 start_codon:yes stop_codon:yes gene_type:complete
MNVENQKLNQELTEALQKLLVKNYDAEKGFIKAMQEIEHTALKGFMQRQAAKRNQFATELDKELHALNARPEDEGSLAADLHRFWIDVKSIVSKDDISSVLEECLRGEKMSADEYENALESDKFPQHLRTVINNQLSQIYHTIEDLQQLDDIAKLR